MASGTQYDRMPDEGEPAAKSCGKKCAKFTGLFFLIFAVLAILVQAALYKWATLKCSAGHLADYEYPGGGKKDLVFPNTLLIEQDPRWWGSSFIVTPSDEVGLATGASTGVYYRTWGPLFYTYTYQDDLGMETFVARDRPLALGGSHKIMRCDGTGPVYVVTEGTHFIMNRIRSIFGMYTSRVYNIYEDSKLVAVSEKIGGVGQSHKQMIFRDPSKATPFASSFLKDRHYHGVFDEWFVHDNSSLVLPAFVPNVVTALMAFPTSAAKHKAAESAKAPPASLVETSLAAAPAVTLAAVAPAVDTPAAKAEATEAVEEAAKSEPAEVVAATLPDQHV